MCTVAFGQHFLKLAGYNNKKQRNPGVRVNNMIRAKDLRVVGPEGENMGIMPLSEAKKKAEDMDLDLIEISPSAQPPIAKIADYGKYLYDQNKKQKQAKAKAHVVEIKNVQVKVGTDENDLNIKAKRVSEWLKEGHRIKVDLFLPGRTKYMNKDFLEGRLERLLKLLTEEYKIAEPAKKSPKGMTTIIERGGKK